MGFAPVWTANEPARAPGLTVALKSARADSPDAVGVGDHGRSGFGRMSASVQHDDRRPRCPVVAA